MDNKLFNIIAIFGKQIIYYDRVTNMLKPLLISTIAGLSTLIGILFIYLKISDKTKNKFIVASLSMSLIIMFYISVFNLLPDGFNYLIYNNSITFSLLAITFFYIIGIFITEIIENKKGVEEGNQLFKLGFISMIILMLHNIPEGIITFITSYTNEALGLKIALSIMLHNIPEGMCIAIPIYYGTKSKRKAFLYTFLASIAEPLGGLIFYLLLKDYYTINFLAYMLILVSGMMINLSINKIYYEAKAYHEKFGMIIGGIIGIFIVIIMHIFI